jgi:hypothetical protein
MTNLPQPAGGLPGPSSPEVRELVDRLLEGAKRGARAIIERSENPIMTTTAETPLHELHRLAREQGLHIDVEVKAPDGELVGGARVTGFDDPMASLLGGVAALRDRARGDGVEILKP